MTKPKGLSKKFDKEREEEMKELYRNYTGQLRVERDTSFWRFSQLYYALRTSISSGTPENNSDEDCLLINQLALRTFCMFTNLSTPHVLETSCVILIRLNAMIISIVHFYKPSNGDTHGKHVSTDSNSEGKDAPASTHSI